MHGMNTIEPPAVAHRGREPFYGARQALDDVNVSIAPSTFAVLLGLNGAGKSTLFLADDAPLRGPARSYPHFRP
jgi:ABC-type sugar transport system ATPase subunit